MPFVNTNSKNLVFVGSFKAILPADESLAGLLDDSEIKEELCVHLYVCSCTYHSFSGGFVW